MSPGSGLLVRVAALAALLPFYYACEWMPLRLAVRDALAATLQLIGRPATPLGGPEVRILLDQGLFGITANCTYADLMLTLAPFAWRTRWSLGANAAALALLVPGVFVYNLARLVLSLELHGRGFSWDQAHHLPDIGFHAAAITTAVLLALRSGRPGERPPLPSASAGWRAATARSHQGSRARRC